ncbi:MAG TPA: PepSY-like domain-containing protein [Pyrinomonadaceae bacterium]|jgi:hypothetical protein|nr:PepSY-like domain-containing protein [Pyrinomonadaceae bacterium]
MRKSEVSKILGLVLALACFPAAHAQQVLAEKVPSIVRQACEERFSPVRKVEWKLKSDHNYEAEFRRNGVEVAAKFDPSGKWLETETTIASTKLPSDVRATISKEFGGYKIIETQTVERLDQKLLLYEVHLENAKEVLKTLFEENGTLVSQSSKPKKRISCLAPAGEFRRRPSIFTNGTNSDGSVFGLDRRSSLRL